jgi:hypothetical protein
VREHGDPLLDAVGDRQTNLGAVLALAKAMEGRRHPNVRFRTLARYAYLLVDRTIVL